MNENTVQQGPSQPERPQCGWCEYKKCGQPAYYRIDLNCDDMNADVCNKHHNVLLDLFGLPDEDE